MVVLVYTDQPTSVKIRDGADSYLMEDGKIVAQTIHYTTEEKQR